MCTAFIKKSKDILFAYNLDIDPQAWDYSLVKTNSLFTVAIKVEGITYYTHGVNSLGQFANLPYMNGPVSESVRPHGSQRLDILVDRYIKGQYRFEDIMEIVSSHIVVNNEGVSMHSLFGDKSGNMLLLEPEFGFKRFEGSYAVATNFPILPKLEDYSNPFFGKRNYDIVEERLKEANDDFDVSDALKLLEKVSQDGQWGTRLSFVYSTNENAVYYVEERNFSNVQKHSFS